MRFFLKIIFKNNLNNVRQIKSKETKGKPGSPSILTNARGTAARV